MSREIVEPFDFSEALRLLRGGITIRRTGWNNSEAFLKLQVPDENSKMTVPYIYIEYPVGSRAYPNGLRCPWLASQTDLLAEDWCVI